MNTIQEQWETFKTDVIPKDAPEIQIAEMKKAFYGGAAVMLTMQLNMPPHISDQAGAMMLDTWMDECTAYFNELSPNYFKAPTSDYPQA